MNRLTATQTKALDFIRTSIDRTGVAPTLREICQHMGYKAVGSAQDLVAALRRKGFLAETDRQAARSFQLTSLARHQTSIPDDGDANTYVIPCIGVVPAGNPIEAVESHVGTLRMSIGMLPKPHPPADELFAVKARGESMIGAGILDGDWLVVRVAQEAPKDSIVVAKVDGDVTVKRLAKDDGVWCLMPENPTFKPIRGNENPFEIVGKVVALQRLVN